MAEPRMNDTGAQKLEVVIVDAGRVACDGDGDPSGHPRVYLNLGERGRVDCPYCGRRFQRADSPDR
jgi:uncharacterized Zn-finger protein